MWEWLSCSVDTTCFGADSTCFGEFGEERAAAESERETRRLRRSELSNLEALIDLIEETHDVFAQIQHDHLLEEAAQVAYWSKDTITVLESTTQQKLDPAALRKATKAVNVLLDHGCDIEDGVRGPFEVRSVKFGYDFDLA
eukprot:CAMPEP_0197323002 /NCGR_PEP_ID=MMETSP0891-20130614/70253_1 /TAXON_ID=44058 ORGANISM="Aureoumbra lagunensis, Strain CCMP1510" /NCGR_SAMPLE_ID=MMETSP0891 /ASSEMBLY_ACC=CAM_ASM_000534 /LENGTH=140 /DNA_ID=CAMNT_0042815545 /DNA_START=1285 /DNA_END=1704 /DNA_ORIENTATION=+